MPFGPKRLEYNQKVEIETRQIQWLHRLFIHDSTHGAFAPPFPGRYPAR
ncbi:hypothetical protein C7S17_4519 [Burkholderia thailandensis]|nr:hypothetical protein [Burkholderia thailandensis]